uniref:Uncharacterized protein n=1 Tax=Anguilla anguilla TaxID=7936 RepID=A0A0E9SKZ8_ANGAN
MSVILQSNFTCTHGTDKCTNTQEVTIIPRRHNEKDQVRSK